MINFKDTLITEVMTNRVTPRHGIADGFKFDPTKTLTDDGYTVSRSSTGKHTIYSKIEKPSPFDKHQTANHFWVNNKTKELDFHVRASTKAGKEPGEKIYHALDTSGRVGAKMGHHAYWDLMSGRTGHAAIMVHDNMSKGARKLQKRIRKHFGDKVLYHTYDPVTGEAKHHDHGVVSSFGVALPGEKITPYNLHKKIGRIQVIGMVPKKYRYQQPVAEERTPDEALSLLKRAHKEGTFKRSIADRVINGGKWGDMSPIAKKQDQPIGSLVRRMKQYPDSGNKKPIATDVEVSLDKIHATQPGIHADEVAHKLKSPIKKIALMKRPDGHYDVADGHHTLAAAHLLGKTSIKADIY